MKKILLSVILPGALYTLLLSSATAQPRQATPTPDILPPVPTFCTHNATAEPKAPRCPQKTPQSTITPAATNVPTSTPTPYRVWLGNVWR